MEHLFEVPTSKKLCTLSKEDLMEYIQYYTCCVSHQRKQILELQKENDRLRAELGYGKTAVMPFVDEGAS